MGRRRVLTPGRPGVGGHGRRLLVGEGPLPTVVVGRGNISTPVSTMFETFYPRHSSQKYELIP